MTVEINTVKSEVAVVDGNGTLDDREFDLLVKRVLTAILQIRHDERQSSKLFAIESSSNGEGLLP